MKSFSGIWFPAAVVSMTVAGMFGGSNMPYRHIPEPAPVPDTVIYIRDAYKLGRTGDLGEFKIADSLLAGTSGIDEDTEALDTLPRIMARDTMKVPEELRETDPFRYKYYVALKDSLTHVIVRDSLKHRVDSLKVEADTLLSRVPPDSLAAMLLRQQARLDSLDWRMVDSVYRADSAAVAQAKFLAWYNSLSRAERKKYDAEQALPAKLALMDSLRQAEEEKKLKRDSTIEYTPRILETFALAPEMQYKRIIEWTVDQDFHRLDVREPDTTYNYHFNDYPFFRKDVNATWLGVPGSPVQMYNFFNRESEERVEFYTAQESWSFSPRTVPNYNTKTPHTELAYYGTILGDDAKESDNLHILTTQNILPELNMTVAYDRFGGGGILDSETTTNKTFSARLNYLGRKYMGHFGYIYNMVDRQENGGIQDRMWVRDTTVEAREIPIYLKGAQSKIVKHTWYLNQQYRIPFDFIKRLKAQKDTLDTAEVQDSLSIDRNVTTAFIGHSSEWSRYWRNYVDQIDPHSPTRYYDTFNYGWVSADSLGTMKLDNKVFLRLQPWGSEGIVSKLDAGIGDELRHYFDSTSLRPSKHVENTLYAYAGAEGQFRRYFFWDAKAKLSFLGYKAGDLEIDGGIKMNFYPFRRARTSPISLSGRFTSTLLTPDYYQRVLNTNHFAWENDFSKISTTKVRAHLDIPRWRLSADVGYALLANQTYYDTLGIVQQHPGAVSVISAALNKDFSLGPVHFDNRLLFQYSSNQEVVPAPTLALNLRWYVQFDIQPRVMQMQIGANGFFNTKWYTPAWNPALGVFHNQNKNLYNNGPYLDLFVNVQWKHLCLYVKYQNVGRGWPMERKDYFTADGYTYTVDGMNGLKLGMFWPFYFNTTNNKPVSR
ncbi:MAG: putative porin [Bacteroidales bacterium]|nr:putative porin [Bacteroidales bacterium]